MLSALVQILQTGTSPQVLAAQQQLLQRLVMDGDVIPSRIPAPLNITEIGGYINLLTTLAETRMRTELLAATLGIAPPPGLLASPSGHPLAMVSVTNDRPSGSFQPSIPLTFQVRTDFQSAILNVLNQLHAVGATLPLLSPPVPLPAATLAAVAPTDWLPILGREMSVMPTVALNDPTSDPIELASVSPGPPKILMALASGSGAPAPAAYNAWSWTSGTLQDLAVNEPYVNLDILLNAAGWYRENPSVTPASSLDASWAVLTNVTGLVSGSTTLQAELLGLFSPNDIGASVAAACLNYVWNGTAFV